MTNPPLDRGAIEDVGIVVNIDSNGIFSFDHVEKHIEVGICLGVRRHFCFQIAEGPAAGKALQIELYLGQGKTAQIPFHAKLANERSVRVGLMLKGLEDKLLRCLQMCKEGFAPAIGFGAAAGD